MASIWAIDPISHSYAIGITTGSHTHSISQPYSYSINTNEYSIDRNEYTYTFETYGRKTGKTEKQEQMTRQQQIDKEVAEALEVPRREAEVKRRVELAEKIGADTYDAGTVLRWKRKFGKNEYSYAAIKASNDQWFVTGQNQYTSSGYKWDDLVQWMVQGESTIEELEVVDVWRSVVQ